ncbi:YggS family pyridoxal phosphate-dependent enzyme [Tahibacter caeni]|uniref:YggS family pyridoxal phosphate-dependent enzyme n=1 Tax=Tahibacter caeni TaxID=1453545 RepID=UPI002147E78B|nr:YggS family pyridoxal phosphate-dependent enzyme [Tahibacter caeni]
MSSSETAFTEICARIGHAAAQQNRTVNLLAVSKTKPAEAVRGLAALGQRRFGENYVQEALAKQRELADLALEWHLIGPLQSNKCREAAEHFDWLQSLDRLKLVAPLARWRPPGRGPLKVLIQVNVDDEMSKSGCRPEDVAGLAAAVAAAAPALELRGLMAIPAPHADPGLRRAAFARMRALFEALRRQHAGVDTLSMGMSEDFELAIAEGATMVRIGSALFGARTAA